MPDEHQPCYDCKLEKPIHYTGLCYDCVIRWHKQTFRIHGLLVGGPWVGYNEYRDLRWSIVAADGNSALYATLDEVEAAIRQPSDE